MTSVFSYNSSAILDRAIIQDQITFLVDASSAPVTITLPDIDDNSKNGSTFAFVKVDSSANAVKVQTTGSFIYQDASDFIAMQTTTPYTYHEFVIINGLYKQVVGEWTGTN